MIVGGCPGLRLESGAATKTWTYRYREPATEKLRQVRIGNWPDMSVAAAAGKWEELRAQRAKGVSPAEEKAITREMLRKKKAAEQAVLHPVKEKVSYSVRDLVRDYMNGHIRVNRKPAGADLLAWQFERMLGTSTLADTAPEDLNRRAAFDFLESWAHTPVQAKLIRQELGAAWDYALDAGRIGQNSVNWWRLVKRGKFKTKGRLRDGKKTSKLIALRDAQAGEVIRFIERGNFSQNIADALIIYLWTGCRGGEIVSMEIGEITEEKDGLWWTCPKEKTKNCWRERADDHRVPLVGRAEAVVRRRLQDALTEGRPYLFPKNPGRNKEYLPWLAQTAISQAVWYHQPYCKTYPTRDRERLHITHWTPHDLRRTARTMLAAIGCDSAVAEAIIGHMKSGIEGVYNLHEYDAERRIWLIKLSEHLERCVALERPCSLAGEGPIPAG